MDGLLYGPALQQLIQGKRRIKRFYNYMLYFNAEFMGCGNTVRRKRSKKVGFAVHRASLVLRKQ